MKKELFDEKEMLRKIREIGAKTGCEQSPVKTYRIRYIKPMGEGDTEIRFSPEVWRGIFDVIRRVEVMAGIGSEKEFYNKLSEQSIYGEVK